MPFVHTCSCGFSHPPPPPPPLQGWNDEQDPTSRGELNSWYLYDWANSVFSSGAVVLTLPLFLQALAEQYACPYHDMQPVVEGNLTNRPNGFRYWQTQMTPLSGNPVWDPYEGHYNTSTMCKFDYDAMAESELASTFFGESYNKVVDPPQFWQEKGRPDAGLNHLPTLIRSWEPFAGKGEAGATDGSGSYELWDKVGVIGGDCVAALELAKIIRAGGAEQTVATATAAFQAMGEQAKQCEDTPVKAYDMRRAVRLKDSAKLDFWGSEADAFLVCDYPAGSDVTFKPMRNVSRYSNGPNEPVEGANMDWGVELANDLVLPLYLDAGSRFIEPKNLVFTSSNNFTLRPDMITATKAEDDTALGTDHKYDLTFRAHEWGRGSTTVSIAEAGAEGECFVCARIFLLLSHPPPPPPQELS